MESSSAAVSLKNQERKSKRLQSQLCDGSQRKAKMSFAELEASFKEANCAVDLIGFRDILFGSVVSYEDLQFFSEAMRVKFQGMAIVIASDSDDKAELMTVANSGEAFGCGKATVRLAKSRL